MSTTPLSQHVRLRLDPSTGQLEALRCEVAVVGGPSKSSTAIPIDGQLVVGSAPEAGLQLADTAVSRLHVELRVTELGVQFKDLGSTNGTWLAGARVKEGLLSTTATLSVGQSSLKVYVNRYELDLPAGGEASLGQAVGASPAIRRVFAALSRMASTDGTIVLQGESGTGKEILARGVHALSPRRAKPFQVVDCAGLSPELIESQLFGHVQGAFSGAVSDSPGAFRSADGGTLFLDQVSELPLAQQPKLLRALESREVKPVGGAQYRPVDVRVIVATHADLEHEVAEGRFRADLFFRLAVVLVKVPPLRERREDIAVLVDHFLSQLGKPGMQLSADLIDQLTAHTWPGNARELRNLLERGLSLGDFTLPTSERREASTLPARPFKEAKDELVESFERDYLANLIEQTGGNLSEVARLAGISRVSVHRLVKRHKLKGGDEP